MKTIRELENELENLNYRRKSLADIINRREMSKEEAEELEILEMRYNDLQRLIREKDTKRKDKFASAGMVITLVAAILFFILTIYTTTSAYHFMNSGVEIGKQVMMGITTILTFVLTVGAIYAYTKQLKLQWK